MQTEEEKAKKA